MRKFIFCTLFFTFMFVHAFAADRLYDDFESYSPGRISEISELSLFASYSGASPYAEIRAGSSGSGQYLFFGNSNSIRRGSISLNSRSDMLPYEKTRIRTNILLTPGKNADISLVYGDYSYKILDYLDSKIYLLPNANTSTPAGTGGVIMNADSEEWFFLDICVDSAQKLIKASLTRCADGEKIQYTRTSDLTDISFSKIFNPKTLIQFNANNRMTPNMLGIDNFEISDSSVFADFSCDGKRIFALVPGDIEISVPYENTVCAALYNSDMQLKTALFSGSDGKIYFPDVLKSDIICVFSWESGTMKPLEKRIYIDSSGIR